MYNIKGPNKIVAKTARRGIPQNIDNMREYAKNNTTVDDKENDNTSSIPKPVFHKKASPSQHRQEAISPQHEEIINFINESWCALCTENGHANGSEEVPKKQPVYYEEEPNPSLRNFKPFDLESWWGKRLYAHLTESTNEKN